MSLKMSADEPQLVEPTIVDTVVVNYFLAVGKFHLLRDLLGTVQVPRVVFDPEDPPGAEEEILSELRRGLIHHELRANDTSLSPRVRRRSTMVLTFFRDLDRLAEQGLLVPIDLTGPELALYSQFRDPKRAAHWSLLVPLGRGEAAALSIAFHRSWTLATDDADGIKVGTKLIPSFHPLRIRSLLKLAVKKKLVSKDEARTIHKQMVEFGFWDKGSI
jgi:predicted nucleic acid-binding protein